ncbi:hypothetical protein LZ32DRAFT_239892 [Colletotrichum eremochloae]|nr:hypothetical protein LZ32DRAFT_239892 [Colletotrichum eremochloae]
MGFLASRSFLGARAAAPKPKHVIFDPRINDGSNSIKIKIKKQTRRHSLLGSQTLPPVSRLSRARESCRGLRSGREREREREGMKTWPPHGVPYQPQTSSPRHGVTGEAGSARKTAQRHETFSSVILFRGPDAVAVAFSPYPGASIQRFWLVWGPTCHVCNIPRLALGGVGGSSGGMRRLNQVVGLSSLTSSLPSHLSHKCLIRRRRQRRIFPHPTNSPPLLLVAQAKERRLADEIERTGFSTIDIIQPTFHPIFRHPFRSLFALGRPVRTRALLPQIYGDTWYYSNVYIVPNPQKNSLPSGPCFLLEGLL